ncbi:MAG: methyltransferase [Ponticaulis sp.]|nr:methyltransferase [Ponticaulis sp.]
MTDQKTTALTEAYLEDKLLPDDPVLTAALERQTAAGLPPIAVSPLQGAFLQIIAQSIGAKRILELGTLAGYSTIWLARGLAEGGKVVTLELQDVNADIAEQNFEAAAITHLIDIKRGDAHKTLNIMINDGVAPFDLVFMDNDKLNYPTYLEQVLHLSRPGTLIIADNVVRDGKITNADSTDPSIKGVRRFFDALKDHPRLTMTSLQTVGAKGYDGFAMMLVK